MYFSDQMLTLKDVSERLEIPFETVRDWSKAERWYAARQIQSLRGNFPNDVLEQAEGIRLALMEKMLDGDDISAADMASLVKAWLSTLQVKKQEGPQLVDRDRLDEMFLDDDTE